MSSTTPLLPSSATPSSTARPLSNGLSLPSTSLFTLSCTTIITPPPAVPRSGYVTKFLKPFQSQLNLDHSGRSTSPPFRLLSSSSTFSSFSSQARYYSLIVTRTTSTPTFYSLFLLRVLLFFSSLYIYPPSPCPLAQSLFSLLFTLFIPPPRASLFHHLVVL